MNYSEQILKARFEQLPEDVREAIMSISWEKKLKQIGDKHNLHIDQTGHLGEETVLVMFGIEHAGNLVPNITKHVEVSEEKAEAIAEDLNREIFLKVRESLKKIFKEKKEETEEKSDTEEMLSREDILREIEDKEHHKLPITKPESHLEIPFPNEITGNPTTPRNIESNYQKIESKEKDEKPLSISISSEENKKKITELQPDALKTMEKDIFKAKMGGTVSVPKETIVISDSAPQPKAKQPSTDKKIDPYREKVGGSRL